jgi:hypothetical protein
MTSTDKNSSASRFAHRVRHELRSYALLSLYLYVCFSAIIIYKMTILGEVGVSYLPFGLPAIKALILGKFILLGQAMKLGDRLGRLRVVSVIAHKAVLYLILIVVLTTVEEMVVGIVHGRTVASALVEFAGNKLSEISAASLIMLLILIPYLAYLELDAALGKDRLWDLLLKYPDRRRKS